MNDWLTISEVADQLDVPPRVISDLFYQRKLDIRTCPIVGRSRIIPASYLPKIREALARESRRREARERDTLEAVGAT